MLRRGSAFYLRLSFFTSNTLYISHILAFAFHDLDQSGSRRISLSPLPSLSSSSVDDGAVTAFGPGASGGCLVVFLLCGELLRGK